MTTPDSNPPIPFGKYKGKRLSDLPYDYLVWLSGVSWNVGDLNEHWGRLAKGEVERRAKELPMPKPAPISFI